ncbi:MAG: response regulator transcription factor [bacterium]|nr:response regulator transcription factor [bacterium]
MKTKIRQRKETKINKKKIFVVDDDEAILDSFQIMLQDEGYEVETSLNGKVLETMVEGLPDIILLDIWLSGINGGDVCAGLKKRKLTKKIPIIIVSANKDTKKIAMQCGADAFIYKPFSIKDLLALIKKHT